MSARSLRARPARISMRAHSPGAWAGRSRGTSLTQSRAWPGIRRPIAREGCFETLVVLDGAPVELDAHLARLRVERALRVRGPSRRARSSAAHQASAALPLGRLRLTSRRRPGARLPPASRPPPGARSAPGVAPYGRGRGESAWWPT